VRRQDLAARNLALNVARMCPTSSLDHDSHGASARRRAHLCQDIGACERGVVGIAEAVDAKFPQ